MLAREHLERVAEHVWEIPKTFRDDMRVPARLYADEDLLDAALSDNSVVQLVNTATLPGVIQRAIAMPDIHQGYGFPIGGVVATRMPEGVISPGGVGYDINCGVPVYRTFARFTALFASARSASARDCLPNLTTRVARWRGRSFPPYL